MDENMLPDGDRIRGRVAQILNHRELVINRGSEHGVERGMKFAVLNRKGAEIMDPETNTPLGSVEIAKVLVQAVRVSSRLAVCRTFRERSSTSMTDLFGIQPGSRAKIETLRTADHTYEEELAEEDSVVKIGDPFVQLVTDEDFVSTTASS